MTPSTSSTVDQRYCYRTCYRPKKDAEIAVVQSRHIIKEQREQLIALLKRVEKAPVFFNPLITSGEVTQISDEIKDELTAAGFEVADVPFGAETLLGLNRTEAFLWFKDGDPCVLNPNGNPQDGNFQ